ncbi:uncharacterized protein WM294_013031 isoform 2-T2 [Sarcoramphus papa]
MHFFFILGALHLPGIPGFIEDGTLFSSPALLYAVHRAGSLWNWTSTQGAPSDDGCSVRQWPLGGAGAEEEPGACRNILVWRCSFC